MWLGEDKEPKVTTRFGFGVGNTWWHHSLAWRGRLPGKYHRSHFTDEKTKVQHI